MRESEKRRVTLRDVAKQAGVSVMTVSLALRNHPDTARNTRRRVQLIAKEMGYLPDPEIAKLMGILGRGKTRDTIKSAVAVINHWREKDEIRRRVHSREMLEGARARAEELGYHLEEHWLYEPHMTMRRTNQILEARGIKGILVPPLPLGNHSLGIHWHKFAAVSMTRTPLDPLLDRVCPNHFDVMRMALDQTHALGYKRVGFVQIEDIEDKVGYRWSAVFNDHLMRVQSTMRVPILMMDSWDERQFLKWFEENGPDAILCDRIHPVNWLQKAGVSIPEDIGFAALFYNRDQPHLSGVDINSHLIGASAMDLLSALLLQNQLGPPHNSKLLEVQPSWIAGSTLRAQ